VRILITGGEGYIGLNLGTFLTMLGHSVVLYDLQSELDILDLKTLTRYARNCHTMIHLAAIPGVAPCNDNPELAWQINYVGTVNAVLAAKRAGVKKLIVASSAAAKNPYTVYGKTKQAVEKLCETTRLVQAWVLRFSNVYGGFCFTQKKDTVVARFLRAIESGETVTVYCDGNQQRDFIHVWEVCSAIKAVIETKALPGVPLEICTGVTRTIRELVDAIGLNWEYGFKLEPKAVPPDPSMAYHVLGWSARDRMKQDLIRWRNRAKRKRQNG